MSAPYQAAVERAIAETTQRQSDASDPAVSAWVGANAGTGKTHVLTSRVLRLLLAGTPPASILCLTYTKAAASEMSARVFKSLAAWVTLPETELAKTLAALIGRVPNAIELDRARTLFTAAIETPGGFKVQTIHAFAERILQRFPLEAGVTPGFTILDDATARELRRDAIDGVLSAAASRPKSDLGKALATAIAYAVEDRFDEVLTAAIANRAWLKDATFLAEERIGKRRLQGLDLAEHLFRSHLGAREDATPDTIHAEIDALLPPREADALALIFDGGSKRDNDRADQLRAIRDASDSETRCATMGALLYDSKGEPRKGFATKGLADANPGMEDRLARIRDRYVDLKCELKAAEVVTATMALHRLADAVLSSYTALKARRAALDFDDLIVKTRSLLLTGASTEWVLYKLDGGLQHLLVDESQDTSPEQWQVVEALASEFFAGEGRHEAPRTLFAVGDEKQSIYSFQGAAPEMFADMGQRFEAVAKSADAQWRRISLDVSFRTVAPVLDAVDAVFRDTSRTPGVPHGPDGMRHVAKRIGQGGRVEIWPTEVWDDAEAVDAWSPLDERPGSEPALRLAARITDTIAGWLANGEMLSSEGRKLRAGDIMILVRKRQPFAGPMVAALKARGIAVAGADRLTLTAHIAVADLMSLGDFLTLPEDDLALAEVLKSPLFGLDDDDLMRIAHGRRGTLWKALLENAPADARYTEAAGTLKRWRKAADFAPPYEFWSNLLERDGMRTRLLARLGPEAADPIDEFLSFALSFDDRAPPSLTGFLAALRGENPELKRDMDMTRDEVRVMTVHGSKGLEAPVVFLPDTCSGAGNGRNAGMPLVLPDMPVPMSNAAARPFVWPIKDATRLAPVAAARANEEAREAEERNRLLYVAMTRARDRLIVTGFEGKKGRVRGCWYDTILEAVSAMPGAVKPSGSGGSTEWKPLVVLEAAQTAAPDGTSKESTASHIAVPRPAWATLPAPREATLSVPLAPSRLAPYDTDESGDPVPQEPQRDPLAEPAPSSPMARSEGGGGGSGGDRFLRGTLNHALLEHLPEFPPAERKASAAAFLAARAAGLPKQVQQSIVSEVLAIIADPEFAALFGPESRAEVAIAAEIANPSGRGPPLRLTGQIDRLAVTNDAVLIIDYKTNRQPPASAAEVAETYLLQLAAYRLALSAIYPCKTVKAALLWTEGAKLMEIPGVELDRATERLWRVDLARLDPAGQRP